MFRKIKKLSTVLEATCQVVELLQGFVGNPQFAAFIPFV
jgi:hypothetical protein